MFRNNHDLFIAYLRLFTILKHGLGRSFLHLPIINVFLHSIIACKHQQTLYQDTCISWFHRLEQSSADIHSLGGVSEIDNS